MNDKLGLCYGNSETADGAMLYGYETIWSCGDMEFDWVGAYMWGLGIFPGIFACIPMQFLYCLRSSRNRWIPCCHHSSRYCVLQIWRWKVVPDFEGLSNVRWVIRCWKYWHIHSVTVVFSNIHNYCTVLLTALKACSNRSVGAQVLEMYPSIEFLRRPRLL